MDRASSLIFPGSRTLAAWWKLLQPHQPQSLHVGYGFVHRIEALVQVCRRQPIEPFNHLVLQALALERRGDRAADKENTFEGLLRRLHLPEAALRQTLLDMEKIGLIERVPSSDWQATQAGEAALASRSYPVATREWRIFPFLESLNGSGQRLGIPRFLSLEECAASPWQVDATHHFDPAWLRDCIAATADDKRRRAFPPEIESLVRDDALPAWQQVVVDRPERILFASIQTGKDASARQLGFAAKTDGWVLFEQKSVFRLPASGLDAQKEWGEPPSASVWQEAWRSWCRQRNLPANEAEACTLDHHPPRLEVQAPERFVQRLRAAKSDLLSGDAWLLVGDGYVRAAVLLTLANAR